MDYVLLSELGKIFLVTPVLGAAFTANLFLFLEILGFKYSAKVKLKCIFPVTMSIFLLRAIVLYY